MFADHYNVLGVSPTSPQHDIKKAYRAMSMKYHPDKNANNPDSIAEFQKINNAYQTIGDPDKRKYYDIEFAQNGCGAGTIGGGSDIFSMSSSDREFAECVAEMSDIVNILFSNMKMPTFCDSDDDFATGPDIVGGIGGIIDGNVGNGGFGSGLLSSLSKHLGSPSHRPGQHPSHHRRNVHRPSTSAAAAVPQQRSSVPPIVQTVVVDIATGFVGTTMPVEVRRMVRCGRVDTTETETMYIDIPPGIDDNEIIMLTGCGNCHNGVSGDVKIFIKISNTTPFERNGIDLIIPKRISLKESLCGFSFEIVHINGKKYTLNNKPCNIICPGHTKIIPKLGFSRDGHVGNLIVRFSVDFPDAITLEQVEKIMDIL